MGGAEDGAKLSVLKASPAPSQPTILTSFKTAPHLYLPPKNTACHCFGELPPKRPLGCQEMLQILKESAGPGDFNMQDVSLQDGSMASSAQH